jgi:hypothetical protein
MIDSQAMVVGNWGLQDVRGPPEGLEVRAGDMGVARMLTY